MCYEYLPIYLFNYLRDRESMSGGGGAEGEEGQADSLLNGESDVGLQPRTLTLLKPKSDA